MNDGNVELLSLSRTRPMLAQGQRSRNEADEVDGGARYRTEEIASGNKGSVDCGGDVN